MNKRLIAKKMSAILALIIVCSVFAGCSGNKDVEETTSVPAEEIAEETTLEATEETYTTGPGIELNDFDDSDFEDSDESESAAAEETQAPTQETSDPTESTEETTAPTEPGDGSTEYDSAAAEYEWYNNLSGAEQKAHMDSFASVEDFFAWYNAAKSAYEALHPDIEIGEGSVDLETSSK